ncbi:MAG TPA: hypothetical protein VM008_16645 [Phycisphaerae bacterium]|nr:hypothetical protein [Phycisphaerae bacterium]
MRSLAVLIATLGLATFSPCAFAQSDTQPATAPDSQPASRSASTQTAESQPAAQPGSRILHNFDFEETKLGNFENLPMFWAKVVGRGFPAFASGTFDHNVFHDDGNGGHTSFRLDIDSGSAAFRYVAPPDKIIRVNPNADYYILGYVKTTPLQFARAEIRAWFADDKGNLIPSSELHSDRYATPVASTNTPDTADASPSDWHVLRLFVPGPHPGSPEAAGAKSLVLQLGLLQPQQLSNDGASADNPLGKFALYQQDIKGTAWFDDIVVFQLPRISIEVPSAVAANIFEPNRPIDLDLTVADLASAQRRNGPPPLNVSLKISDTDGLLFASEKWDIHTNPDQTWTHHYTHAPLPPALYTATLEVADGNTRTLIARRQTRFLAMADLPVGISAAGGERVGTRFGLNVTQWPVENWDDIPLVSRYITAGLVQVPAWRRDMSESAMHTQDPPFDKLLNSLGGIDARVLGDFSELPSALSEKISEAAPATNRPPSVIVGKNDSLLALLNADPTLWRPYASFLLARYSNFVDAWEIGSPQLPFSGSLSEVRIDGAKNQYPDLFARVYKELAGLLSPPRLVIPWNALFDFDIKSYPHAILDLRIPNVIKPAQICNYIHNFADSARAVDSPPATRPANLPPPDTTMYVHIDPLEDAGYSRIDRLSDFAQRIIYARSTNPLAVLIDLPLTRTFSVSSGVAHTEPDETLLVYRTLVRILGTASYRREISIAPGVRGFLFVRDESDGSPATSSAGHEGILAVWNESAPDPVVPADLPLGTAPREVQLNGLSHPLPLDPASHLTHLNITNVPTIITFVDAHLVELRASFALSNALLPAGAGILQTEVQLSNPYNEPISASMRLNPPPGWTIDTPNLPINIPPGGTYTQRITIRYPFTEVAGAKQLNATLTSDGDGPGSGGHPLQLSLPLAVKSDSVDTEGFARLMPNGDLVVQQMITNISTIPLNAEAYALIPGYARQQHFVVNLPPGQTTIKRFLFPMSTNVDFTKKMTPADIGALLAGKAATIGLRQNNGKTLITKSFPLN